MKKFGTKSDEIVMEEIDFHGRFKSSLENPNNKFESFLISLTRTNLYTDLYMPVENILRFLSLY